MAKSNHITGDNYCKIFRGSKIECCTTLHKHVVWMNERQGEAWRPETGVWIYRPIYRRITGIYPLSFENWFSINGFRKSFYTPPDWSFGFFSMSFRNNYFPKIRSFPSFALSLRCERGKTKMHSWKHCLLAIHSLYNARLRLPEGDGHDVIH